MSSEANPKPLPREILSRMRLSLIAQIERDFAGVNREGGVSIREADVLDGFGSMVDRKRARAEDTDTHWSEVNIDELDPCGSALSFFDSIGFRYHYPAYMIFSLRHGDHGNGEWIDSNCHDRARYSAENMDPHGGSSSLATEQFSLFNDAQRRCVARFLVCELEHELTHLPELLARPLGALKRYWIQFLDAGEANKLRERWPQLRD